MVYTVGVKREGNRQTSCTTAGQIIRDLLHCVSQSKGPTGSTDTDNSATVQRDADPDFSRKAPACPYLFHRLSQFGKPVT